MWLGPIASWRLPVAHSGVRCPARRFDLGGDLFKLADAWQEARDLSTRGLVAQLPCRSKIESNVRLGFGLFSNLSNHSPTKVTSTHNFTISKGLSCLQVTPNQVGASG